MKKVTYVGTLKGIDMLDTKKNNLMFIIEEMNCYKVLFKTYNVFKDFKTVTNNNELNYRYVFKCYKTKTKLICYDYWYAFYDNKTYELLNLNYENEHRKNK